MQNSQMPGFNPTHHQCNDIHNRLTMWTSPGTRWLWRCCLASTTPAREEHWRVPRTPLANAREAGRRPSCSTRRPSSELSYYRWLNSLLFRLRAWNITCYYAIVRNAASSVNSACQRQKRALLCIYPTMMSQHNQENAQWSPDPLLSWGRGCLDKRQLYDLLMHTRQLRGREAKAQQTNQLHPGQSYPGWDSNPRYSVV